MPDTALIVSASSPVPVDSGKRVFLNGLLEYFVDRLGASNVHYAMLDDGGAHPSFPGVVHYLKRPGPAEQLVALARCVTDRSYTAQEAMLGSRAIREQIRALVTSVRPTVEVYDTLRLGQHAPAAPRAARRVLYLDDLFSVRYDRMLSFAAANTGVTFDPLGEFASNVPAPLRPLIRHSAVYRPVLRMERDRIRRREAAAVAGFDLSLLVNIQEVELLRRRSGASTVELIHDLLPPVAVPERRPVSPPELVFLGRLNLPHNDDAICEFLRTAMAGMERRCPGVRLRIIGKGASATLRALVARHPASVTLEGYVERLDDVFARATASLAPLRMGSGIKIKMLEAFARGLPVLSTELGVDGILTAPDGSDGCLIENDLSRWPDLIAGLADERRAREVSDGALAFFARTYGREVVAEQYDRLFGLEHRRPAPATPPRSIDIPAQRTALKETRAL